MDGMSAAFESYQTFRSERVAFFSDRECETFKKRKLRNDRTQSMMRNLGDEQQSGRRGAFLSTSGSFILSSGTYYNLNLSPNAQTGK